MPEIKEIIERIRGDRGIDDLIAVMAAAQPTFDLPSFIAGTLSRGGGHGLDRTALLLFALTSSNALNTQQTANGTTTVNPMQQMLPLLLLMGRDDWDGREKSVEFIEKRTGGGRP